MGEDGEIVFAADEAGVRVQRGEVGGEHGGGDLAAVGAVADEGALETGGFEGLGISDSPSGEVISWDERESSSLKYDSRTHYNHLHLSTRACSRRLILVGPAVIGLTLVVWEADGLLRV